MADYSDILMASGMPAAQARVLAAPFEVAPPDALPGTNIDRLPTVPLWGEISPEATIAMNCYLDKDSKWRFLNDGPAALLRLPRDETFQIMTLPPGVAGELCPDFTVVWQAPGTAGGRVEIGGSQNQATATRVEVTKVTR
jgi:hypothetical protein